MRSINTAYCYRESSVVCLICLLVTTLSPAKTAEPAELQFGGSRLARAEGMMCLIGMHVGTTWRIRWIDLCDESVATAT